MNAVLTTPQTERITLYYREGSNDKVYQVSIEPQGEGFVVNFAYGRRGSTMSTGTKTQTPVDYDTAKSIYDKLVREKKAKGYTAGPDGTPYQNTLKEDRVTGLLPQLLNPIDEQEVKRLLKDQDGEDCRTKPYRRRLLLLSNLLNRPNLKHIRWVQTATDPANKERLFRHLQAERKEGVVFKRLDAPYTPGRPNSGGNQLKHKFYATLSAVVDGINDKRSVELRLLNGKGWIPVGNVTIPPNFKVPAVGEVVETRFLYAFRESNALYQPVYLGPRQDIGQHECALSQLK